MPETRQSVHVPQTRTATPSSNLATFTKSIRVARLPLLIPPSPPPPPTLQPTPQLDYQRFLIPLQYSYVSNLKVSPPLHFVFFRIFPLHTQKTFKFVVTRISLDPLFLVAPTLYDSQINVKN